MEFEVHPSSSRHIGFEEIDPNAKDIINSAAVEGESMGAEDAEEHEEEVNWPSKKRKKRAKNDDGGEDSRPKKQQKKGKGRGAAFASNEHGKKTLKVGPKTTMKPRAALKQISNSLMAVMAPSGVVLPSPQPDITTLLDIVGVQGNGGGRTAVPLNSVIDPVLFGLNPSQEEAVSN